MNRYRFVSRQGPWRRGPDHDTDWLIDVDVKYTSNCLGIREGELHVNRDGFLVLIFNLCFRKRRATVRTPVNRLEAFVQVSGINDLAKGADDVGFKFEVHGQVRVFPVTQNHQAFEIVALTINLLSRVFTTMLAELAGADLLTDFANLSFNLQFDRQTMAVPTRNIRRIFTAQRLGLDDDVFQNLVNCVTDVNIAVRVRRAIMQNKFIPSCACFTDFAVQTNFFPARQHFRLTLCQISTHWKFCIRQVQCRFVLAFHFIVHKFTDCVRGLLR